MPIFRYEVVDTGGKTLRGAMDAPTPQEVERRLTEKGYRQIQIVPPAGAAPSVTPFAPAAYSSAPNSSAPPTPRGLVFGTVKPQDLASFFRQMASLIHSGFTAGSALTDLGGRVSNRALRNAATDMGRAVLGGASLAGQMTHFPSLFPAHIIALTAAGEQGGFLEFAFEEAALWAEQEAALRQGLWIPKFLIWQSVWSVLLFQPLFPSLDMNNFMKSVSNYFHALFFICVPIGLILHAADLFVDWLRHQPSARPFFDRLSLGVPAAARFSKMQAMAAFTRVLRRLLMSGISPEVAFVGAANAAPNSVLRERLLLGAPVLRGGQGLDAAVRATGLMDSDPLNLLITGQMTGQWQEMLERVTQHYQEEAARAMEGVKSVQRRAGVVLTLVSGGYVMIAATYGLATLGFRFTEGWDK